MDRLTLALTVAFVAIGVVMASVWALARSCSWPRVAAVSVVIEGVPSFGWGG